MPPTLPALNPNISLSAQRATESRALEESPALGTLGLSEADLARIPVYALREICLSKASQDQAMPWVLAGGLAMADQRPERDSFDSLGEPRSIRVCADAYAELIQRFKIEGSGARFDFLRAACLGVERLSTLHGAPESADSAMRDFFERRVYPVSSQLQTNREERPDQQDLGPEFDDPRASWLHIPQNALFCALTPLTRFYDQLEKKIGFPELLFDALAREESLRQACAFEASRGALPPEHPTRRALELSLALGAWNPQLANQCAFPGRHWPYSASKIAFAGRDTIQALAPGWPLSAFDPEDPMACVLRAQRHDPESPWADEYLRAAGSAGLREAMVREQSFHGLFGGGKPPFFKAAGQLDARRLETLMDLIDQEGPDGWAAWCKGSPLEIELPGATQPKIVDWLFALGSLRVEPRLVARAVGSAPGYSHAQSRATARWLRERSERGASRKDKERAAEILEGYFPLFEALDLAQASKKASSRAAARRGEDEATPAKAPAPRRI